VAIDKLVAAVRAEPSGAALLVVPTLTLGLPAGSKLPPYGLRGFLSANDGSRLEYVPQRRAAGVVTMQVRTSRCRCRPVRRLALCLPPG
jgi:hypothetical protein